MSESQRPEPRRSITISLPSFARIRSNLRLPRPGLARLGRGRLAIGLLVLVLAVAVVDVLMVRQASAQQARADSRAAAMQSAAVRVPVMLSYSYRTLDDDLVVATGNATGSFRKDFADALSTVVAPNAMSKKITTKADVVGSSVVSGGGDDVTLLLFVTQSTLTGDSQKPTTSGSRITVRMKKTDAGWLVAGITPV